MKEFNPSWFGCRARWVVCQCPLCGIRHRFWLDWRGIGVPRIYDRVCAKRILIIERQHNMDMMSGGQRLYFDIESIADDTLRGTMTDE